MRFAKSNFFNFNKGLIPIYQWVPPNLPQIISPLFREHLVPGFSISDDPLTRHRALNIGNVTTDLSGLYSCRVSSNSGDSFKSKHLTVFCKSVGIIHHDVIAFMQHFPQNFICLCHALLTRL